MTYFKWAMRFCSMWSVPYFGLLILIMWTFLAPWSSSQGSIDNSSVVDTLFNLSIVYFPYLGVSVAGTFAFRNRRAKTPPAHVQTFAKTLSWIILGFNLTLIVFTVIFVFHPTMGVDFYNLVLTRFFSLFSIFLAGLITFFYA